MAKPSGDTLWIDPEPYYGKVENLQPVGVQNTRGVNLVGDVLEPTRHAGILTSRYRLGWKRER